MYMHIDIYVLTYIQCAASGQSHSSHGSETPVTCPIVYFVLHDCTQNHWAIGPAFFCLPVCATHHVVAQK